VTDLKTEIDVVKLKNDSLAAVTEKLKMDVDGLRKEKTDTESLLQQQKEDVEKLLAKQTDEVKAVLEEVRVETSTEEAQKVATTRERQQQEVLVDAVLDISLQMSAAQDRLSCAIREFKNKCSNNESAVVLSAKSNAVVLSDKSAVVLP
jgi:hypothetical protein